MLTYTWAPADAQRMEAASFKGCKSTKLYDPPIDEFSVALVDTMTSSTESHPPVEGPSIIVVTQLEGGEGKIGGCKVERVGQVFFVGAGEEVEFEGKMVAYRAFVEV